MGQEQQEKGLAAAKERLLATQGVVAKAMRAADDRVRSDHTIPIHLVAIEDRLRAADETQVSPLVESVREVGILNPITVYKRKVIHDHLARDGYGLVAGLHRLAAAKRLGLEDIPAHIVTLTDLQRQIAECDENLCGPKLTASERARFTSRRKQAYEALHPETRQGVAGGKARQGAATAKLSFAADTAKRTGQSERSVQRDAARAEDLGDDLLQQAKGTSLDNGAALDALTGLPKSDRQAVVDRAAKGEKVTASEVERLKRQLAKAKEQAADDNSRLLFAQDVARTAEEQRDKAQNEALFLRADKERLEQDVAELREEQAPRAPALDALHVGGAEPAGFACSGKSGQDFWIAWADMSGEERDEYWSRAPRVTAVDRALAAYDALTPEERLQFHEQRPDPTEPFVPPANLRVKIPQQSA